MECRFQSAPTRPPRALKAAVLEWFGSALVVGCWGFAEKRLRGAFAPQGAFSIVLRVGDASRPSRLRRCCAALTRHRPAGVQRGATC